MVATQGWLKSSDVTYGELINTYNSLDLEGILVTDIAKDGMLQGPNLELIKDVASLSKNPIIASGGVASLNDIKSLSLIQNVKGVVVGKAFYKNTITPQEVINNNL